MICLGDGLWVNDHGIGIPFGIKYSATGAEAVLLGCSLICRCGFNGISGQDYHIVSLVQEVSAECCTDHSCTAGNQNSWHMLDFAAKLHDRRRTIATKS
jgi:hypothetical protein